MPIMIRFIIFVRTAMHNEFFLGISLKHLKNFLDFRYKLTRLNLENLVNSYDYREQDDCKRYQGESIVPFIKRFIQETKLVNGIFPISGSFYKIVIFGKIDRSSLFQYFGRLIKINSNVLILQRYKDISSS